MIVTLQTQGLQTLEQVRGFMAGNAPVLFTLNDRAVAHVWMTETLRRFGYHGASRADRGVLRRYLAKVTGLSRAQVTRRITQFLTGGRIADRRHAPAVPFARRYTTEDIRLLADVDALHGTLSGSTTRKLCERAFAVYGDPRFERLAGISNGHLYNLRSHKTYSAVRGTYDKTRPVKSHIGERRKPFPDGRPGFLRVDSVHQGDMDGIKGAYPFIIRGFHSDNGSEYINHTVAKLLKKLLIEQTKSRSRQTNDNALAESKNASTVRKHLGYSHIPGRFAQAVNRFTTEALSPYLNFHRPCHFPTEITDDKGRQRKRYRYADMMTPYEKLKALPEAKDHLRPDVSFNSLDAIAGQCSDNEAASCLNEARAKLFQLINKPQQHAA